MGFESLRDHQKIMNEQKFRKFKKTDTDEVIKLWKTCKLIVPWNDPLKDIKRKLSINDDLFIIISLTIFIRVTTFMSFVSF